ncbi:uncharacterized protein LOC120339124 [Styela clava]|uniref:uncharacterized protein LOC120339124 n=1 Tax=Styela clava TaxID=7725 RepID=UPI00193A5B4E|nr:uncharacterized protein LOC120339124 [Styela clava]
MRLPSVSLLVVCMFGLASMCHGGYIPRFAAAKRLKCWECEDASSDAHCFRVGKWKQCGPSQSCFVEKRYENGIEVHKRGCKQDSACKSLMMQNEFQCNSLQFKKHFQEYSTNPITCRHCCDMNYCNPTRTDMAIKNKLRKKNISNKKPPVNRNEPATGNYPMPPVSHYSVKKNQNPVVYPTPHQAKYSTPSSKKEEEVWYTLPHIKTTPYGNPDHPTNVAPEERTTEPVPTPYRGKMPADRTMNLGQVYYPGIGWISLTQSKEQRAAPPSVVYNQEKSLDVGITHATKELNLND